MSNLSISQPKSVNQKICVGRHNLCGATPFFRPFAYFRIEDIPASKGRTDLELNNHFKMFRRLTLWGTNQGFKVLRPSVFELLATPFFRTRNFGRKMEKSTLYRKFA